MSWRVVAALVVAGAVAFGLYWFQPWKLWVDKTVDEAFPDQPVTSGPASPGPGRESSATSSPDRAAGSPTAEPTADPSADASGSGQAPTRVSGGDLISHEHATSGSVSVYRLADGARVLRITDLDTSNGPDLQVWLSDAPVTEGSAGWHVFDDGAYADLGELRGNRGNLVYEIPDDVDLRRLTSVSIWCDRFDVSFGAAALVSV